MTGMQVGAFLGPLAGGLLASVWDWRAAFVLAAAVALAVSLPAWRLVVAPLPPRRTGPAHRLRLSSFRLTRPVLGVVALSMLLTGPMMGQRSVVLPLYGSVGLDLDPGAVGLIIAIVNGVRAVLGLLGGSLMDRVGRGAALFVQVASGTAASLLLLFSPGLGVYALIGSCMALSGTGAFLPSVLIGDRAPPDRIGISLGILLSLGAAVAIGAITGIGYLLDFSDFGTVGLVMAAPLVAAWALGLRLVGWRGAPEPGAATRP
jgi:MFS family permease